MPLAISSLWKPLKPILLLAGIATALAACNVHDSGRRGPAHYSERHWHDNDRNRHRHVGHHDRDKHRHGWRQDHRRDGRDRDRRRRHWDD